MKQGTKSQLATGSTLGLVVGVFAWAVAATAAQGGIPGPPDGVPEGGIPQCQADLMQTQGELAGCSADLSTCNSDLSTCNSDLSMLDSDLSTCNSDLDMCDGNLANCQGDFSACKDRVDELEALPVCGDGFVDPEEQCDVGNLNGETCESLGYVNGGTLSCQAGCTFDTTACNRTVFVTSETFDGDLVSQANDPTTYDCNVSDGLAAGDCICQKLADAAGLKETFKAWLSVEGSGGSPLDRFIPSLGSYHLPSLARPMVAFNFSDLTDGSLIVDIDTNENGVEIPQDEFRVAWTGTLPDGTFTGLDHTNNCENWTSNEGCDSPESCQLLDVYGEVGSTRQTDNRWSFNGLHACDFRRRLYCFGQAATP